MEIPEAERYGSTEVLQVARAFRKSLIAGHPISSDGYLIMGGSFPNGRARLPGSDIDVLVSSPAIDQILDGDLVKAKTPSVTEPYARIMQGLDAEIRKLDGAVSTLETQKEVPRFFRQIDHATFFGGLQPISIVVTASSIKLRVHSSHGTGWAEGSDEMKEFLIE